MSSLGRSTRGMAVGTVASRATGFLRTAAIAAVLGVKGVGAAFNVANTTPNIVYELLLGGILTSVLVPLLVQAAKTDADRGEAYAQRLLSLVIVGLAVASVLLVLLAPALVDLYMHSAPRNERRLAVALSRFFLPQVLFYGAGAVLGAILNTRARFGAPMWAPVLNNLVAIATCLLFLALPGSSPLSAASISDAQVLVLGVGTTLGIVAQTVVLLPALRSTGFPLRLRTDLRGSGLRSVGRLSSWVLLYVAANQVAFLVIVRLSNDRTLNQAGRGYASYINAFVLWQLPHAIVAVSVITALLPRMSAAAVDGRFDELREILNRGLRLTVSLLVPASVAYLVLGRVLATVVFAHLRTSVPEAQYIGTLLAVFAVGLVPFSAYQLQLRAFYAMQDTRTATLVNLGVNVTVVVVGVTLFAVLPAHLKVAGLVAGNSASFVAGLLLCSRVLSRRLGGLAGGSVVRTGARCLVASVVPGLLGAAVVAALGREVGDGPAGSLLSLLAGASVIGAGYLLLARRMRIAEITEILDPLMARLRPRRA